MYLTLPSNSSLKFFPNNKAGHFTTKLPQTLTLGDDYEVGLSEIQFRNHFQNITNNNVWFEYLEYRMVKQDNGGSMIKKELKKVQVPNGLYETNAEFVNELNALIVSHLANDTFNAESQLKHILSGEIAETKLLSANALKSLIEANAKERKNQKNKKIKNNTPPFNFKYNPFTKKVSLFHYYTLGEVRISEELKDILGLPRVIFEGMCNVEGEHIMDLTQNVKGIFVYSDLVRTRPVGDVSVPLLRTLPPINRNQETMHYLFEKPQYMPLARFQFDTVELLLTSDRGQPISFDNGHTIATLHFRRKRIL